MYNVIFHCSAGLSWLSGHQLPTDAIKQLCYAVETLLVIIITWPISHKLGYHYSLANCVYGRANRLRRESQRWQGIMKRPKKAGDHLLEKERNIMTDSVMWELQRWTGEVALFVSYGVHLEQHNLIHLLFTSVEFKLAVEWICGPPIVLACNTPHGTQVNKRSLT